MINSFFKHFYFSDIAYLLFLLVIPSFCFVYFKLSSLSYGLVLWSISIVFFNFRSTINIFNYNVMIIIVVFFGILFLQGSYFLFEYGLVKPIYSLVSLFLIFFSIILFSQRLGHRTVWQLQTSFIILCYMLVIIGWIALIFPVDLSAYMIKEKPVFPFSEQSHYALATGMVFISVIFYSSKKQIYFLLINLVLQAILFPNLTLLVFCFLALLIISSLKKVFLFILLILVIITGFLSLEHLSEQNIVLSYFYSRLNFSDTGNLTTLVFFQGIEDAYNSLISTNGIGLGFQRAGSLNNIGYFGDLIETITNGNGLNREDGGFLASKIISEFGIIGVIFIVFLFIKIIKVFFLLKKNSDLSFGKKLSYSSLLSISIEIFLRGYGYFSPTLCLFFVFYITGIFIDKKCQRME